MWLGIRITTFALLVGVPAGRASAQDTREREAPKWGEISPAQLTMDRYGPDSNAVAVVLSDYGNVSFDGVGGLVFKRRTRVKILSEAGYEWGTVSIPYLAEDGTQKVRGIRGRTYNTGDAGRLEPHDLADGSVFDEDVDGRWKRVRFTLPALRPGSVIEYEYTIASTNPGFLPDWSFQEDEPVLRSEYRAEIPEVYRYVSVFQGNLTPDVVDAEPYSRMMQWNITVAGGFARASTSIQGMRHRWVMYDVPALREEAYMTTPENFRAKIRFELAEITPPSSRTVRVTYRGETVETSSAQLFPIPVMTSWEQLAQELMDAKSFGKQLGRHREVRDRARALVEQLTTPQEKMQAVFDYLRTSMVWTGKRGVFAERDLDDVLTARNGDGPELALLLTSMLREVGFEAEPVLISTRSHGQVQQVYPLTSQFNHVLTYVEVDTLSYLLDVTDPLRPYTMLPLEALSGTGFLVRKWTPTWIPIHATEEYRYQRFLTATLDSSGSLTGAIKASDGGYSALQDRRALKDAAEEPEAFVEEILLDGLEGARVDSVRVINEEAVTEELKTEATFSAPAYAQVASDFMYVNPTPLGRLKENPFLLPERTFPVDLAYPWNQVFTFTLSLPEGYTVQEAPRNVRIRLSDDAGVYQRFIQDEGHVLLAQTQLVIKQTVFEPERYEELRSFFEKIVAAEAEPVVLHRTAP